MTFKEHYKTVPRTQTERIPITITFPCIFWFLYGTCVMFESSWPCPISVTVGQCQCRSGTLYEDRFIARFFDDDVRDVLFTC